MKEVLFSIFYVIFLFKFSHYFFTLSNIFIHILFPHLYISISALHLFMVMQIPCIYPAQTYKVTLPKQTRQEREQKKGGSNRRTTTESNRKEVGRDAMRKGYSPETHLKHTIAGQEKTVSERVLLCHTHQSHSGPYVTGERSFINFLLAPPYPECTCISPDISTDKQCQFSSTIISSANALSVSVSHRRTVQYYQFSI